MNVHDFKFYGSTTVGAKGQVVLPAKLRKEMKIAPGDKLVVLLHQLPPAPNILIVKSRDITEIIQKIFGEDNLQKIIKPPKRQRKEKHEKKRN